MHKWLCNPILGASALFSVVIGVLFHIYNSPGVRSSCCIAVLCCCDRCVHSTIWYGKEAHIFGFCPALNSCTAHIQRLDALHFKQMALSRIDHMLLVSFSIFIARPPSLALSWCFFFSLVVAAYAFDGQKLKAQVILYDSFTGENYGFLTTERNYSSMLQQICIHI